MTGHVITGWSAVSPYGIGAKVFADGIEHGPAIPARLSPEDGTFPGELAYRVPDFDIRTVLGRKGTRSMDRMSALAVTAARELLESGALGEAGVAGGAARTGPARPGVGLVLGTTAGSVQSMHDLTQDMLVNERPFYVDPARIPGAVMNGAAAQCAIWHQLRGPNTTIGGGRSAGLLALRYASRLLAAGRAEAVLCGGAEEFTPARAWLEYHGRAPGEPDTPLAEGAALLLLQPAGGVNGLNVAGCAGGPVLAEVLAVEPGVHGGGNAASVLAACLSRAFTRAGVAVADVWAVSTTAVPGPLGDAERAAVDQVLGEHRAYAVPPGQPWGDAGAVAVPFQIAAVLHAAVGEPHARGRVAVVTAVDSDGVLGCALLRTSGMENR